MSIFVTFSTIVYYTSGNKKNVNRSKVVLPVTVKMILQAKQEGTSWKIGAFDVPLLSLVGLITHEEIETTHGSYTISDTSGTMKAEQWTDSDDPILETYDGSYVRIIGSIHPPDATHTQNSVSVSTISEITDFNEITLHGLEVLYSRLILKRLSDKNNDSEEETNNSHSALSGTTSFADEISSTISRQLKCGVDQTNSIAFKSLDDTVLEIIKKHTTQESEGATIQDIIHELSQQGIIEDEYSIKNVVEHLINEALAYPGIDDEHFRSTD